jgi:ATP-binding cassette subfamily C protein
VRGESGSGKSTFADLLIGLREPDAGQIIVGGVPLSDYLRMDPRGIALVPQEIHLFDGTIAANVALSFKGEIPDFDRVTDALVEAGLMTEVDSLPQGIQTQIGKYGHRLSGGQVQRIGLARALYQKPKILLLDEATSALDQESEATIVKTLSRLKGRVTLIVIAHRPATLSLSDQELVF